MYFLANIFIISVLFSVGVSTIFFIPITSVSFIKLIIKDADSMVVKCALIFLTVILSLCLISLCVVNIYVLFRILFSII